MRPASGTRAASSPAISGGIWSVKTLVSDSAMRSATGSASCTQNGMVARIHCVRVSAPGASGSVSKTVDSSSQSPATENACCTSVSCWSVADSEPAPAAAIAWSVAIDQSMRPSGFCIAWRSCAISCSRPAAPPGSPIAFASAAVSGAPPPAIIRRSISCRSGSAASSGSSAMRLR